MAIWEGFSWRWYEAAWHNEQVIEASLRSLDDRELRGADRDHRGHDGGARHDPDEAGFAA